ncbi:hypothetical protein NDU88_003020 [Pleurodeles waltl]|uniref:Uncharacterized protein n=1 Tax=Pleurodeles waltl TaxID=8319 RepID=A0AAV7Q8V3_PLEWA|nr:hypothetical protein NDU88_003020 [Pleurodeles waltl]
MWGSLRAGPLPLPGALQGERCLQTGTDTERHFCSGKRIAMGRPRQRPKAPPVPTAPQMEEEGATSPVHGLTCTKPDISAFSRRAERRGECRYQAPRLWGVANRSRPPSSPM